MILCNGKPQEERGFGEPTGFVDCHLSQIRVGDRMNIRHDCNCDRCQHYEDVEIAWNQDWRAYGMLTRDGRWISGMGIAGGYSVSPQRHAMTQSDHEAWNARNNIRRKTMKREEFCIAQSIIAAVKNISSMYESSGSEQEIHLGDSRYNIIECVKNATSEWQRENAVELLSSLVVPNSNLTGKQKPENGGSNV